MTFKEVLAQVVNWLQQDGRVSHRAIKRQFNLDDGYLEDLKEALLYTHVEMVNDDGQGLVWTGMSPAPISTAQDGTELETQFHRLLAAIILLLQRERRVTYRTLKWTFGIDDACLQDVQEELSFKQLARDADGKGLVWTGEVQAPVPPTVTVHSPLPSTTSVEHLSVEGPTWPLGIAEIDPEPTGPIAPSEVWTTDVSTDVLLDAPIVASEPSRRAPEAERRQLTVMFCDLVGSTDLSSQLDPEELREVVHAYQETAAEIIARYEGHIAQYLGDGLLIYFGYPMAHEDDAQRAVYTGLEIPKVIATLNTRLEADYGVQLAVRIGIHTGPVVVGEMGGGGRHENLALGETPNIAARLEGLAQANTVVISPVTAQLIQPSFALTELGYHELKGVVDPMMLYTVVAPRPSDQADADLMIGGFDALVGRDEEIGLLLRRWEQSREGLGQVVLLSGEAGIGKSSLVGGLPGRMTRRCRRGWPGWSSPNCSTSGVARPVPDISSNMP